MTDWEGWDRRKGEEKKDHRPRTLGGGRAVSGGERRERLLLHSVTVSIGQKVPWSKQLTLATHLLSPPPHCRCCSYLAYAAAVAHLLVGQQQAACI